MKLPKTKSDYFDIVLYTIAFILLVYTLFF